MNIYLFFRLNLIISITAIFSTFSENDKISKNTFSEVEIIREKSDTNFDSIPSNNLGELLWFAGHESGNQSEWTGDGGGGEFNSGTGNSAVSSQLARTGNRSLKLSINTASGNSHGTRNYRWKEIAEYNDIIFTQYVYFPARIDLDPRNAWFNLMQTKGVKFAPGGPGTGRDQINNPHFSVGIGVRGGAGSGGANYLTLADLLKFWGGTNAVWEAPAGLNLPTNRWVKIQMRIIQDRGNNGRVLLWQDDVLVVDTGLRNTLRPEVDVNQFSSNAYADKTIPNITAFYIDDLSINLPDDTQSQAFKITTTPSNGGEIKIAQFSKNTDVQITSPVNNSKFLKNTTISIKAVASNPVSEVERVEYFRNGTLIGTSTNSPLEFNWTNTEAGVYQIQVKAYFKNGETKYSQINNMLVE